MKLEQGLSFFSRNHDKAILSRFTPEQSEIIRDKQGRLEVLASYIGKDFKMPVLLNQPGGGWYWDAQANEVKIDPQDLLEKPMDYLRFVISHEGGHRRISRIDFISNEEWSQPGFSFMMNAIEDPRDNNFVAEAYPPFQKQMELAYQLDLDFEAKLKQKAGEQLGQPPRFMQAGFEYIKQWFRAVQGLDFEISSDLPEDVRRVVALTLLDAEESWQYYPSKEEADRKNGERWIRAYAHKSYEINRERVWPQFKTLVDADLQDQRTKQFMDQMRKKQEQADPNAIPPGLKKDLTPEELDELQGALSNQQRDASENRQNNLQENKSVNDTPSQQSDQTEHQQQTAENTQQSPASASNGDESETLSSEDTSEANQESSDATTSALDSQISPELAEKLREFIDSLPPGQKSMLEEQAKKALEAFEKELNEEIAGKLSDQKPPKRKRRIRIKNEDMEKIQIHSRANFSTMSPENFKKAMETKLYQGKTSYERVLESVLPLADKLEQDLREIFIERAASRKQSGYRTGRGIDIGRRMQERAREIPASDSRAWERREKPGKKDYAIVLLVDLSGSMNEDGKINEAYKATILLAEVLNRMSIKTEIIGFTDRLYLYQQFDQPMSDTVRENMTEIPYIVHTPPAQYNDDGWVLLSVSERLAKRKEREKFIFVLSDGTPVPSGDHAGHEYELGHVVKKITSTTGQKLIGLGIGPGTEHVTVYYPDSLANITIEELAQTLGEKVREVIANA